MSTTPGLAQRSARVAAGATAIVAVAYLVIGIVVVSYVTSSLTGQIDTRLAGSLDRMSDDVPSQGMDPSEGTGQAPHRRDVDDRPLGPERAAWWVSADGTVISDQDVLSLPLEYRDVTAATTAVVGGLELRLRGRTIGDEHLVVAEAMDPVADARTTFIVGGLLVAPVLLAAVFVGAVIIGRRVAAPIEAARQRQLDFTADASHELRTPLAVIEAHASLALAHDRDAAWYRRAFENVDAEARRMRRLLEDLLWLARFDATHELPEGGPVDLVTIARRAGERFEPVAETKGLTLAVVTPDQATVSAPADWLDRLLGVLLDNACKYSPTGGTVTVRVTMEDRRVLLAVEDTGPGIPDQERARIFDRFRRATDGGMGAGLGLAIGDAIVRRTGGRWDVVSGTRGTRFSVSWPRGLATV